MAAIWEAIYPYVSVLLPTITLILIFCGLCVRSSTPTGVSVKPQLKVKS